MQLEITQEGQVVSTLPLSPGIHTIGRGAENTICLDDNGISRVHAQLEVSADLRVKIVDLQSTNGTWLGPNKITTSDWTETGLSVQIGGYQLFLRVVQQPIQKPSPVATPSLPAYTQPSAPVRPPMETTSLSTHSAQKTVHPSAPPLDPSTGMAGPQPVHRVVSDKKPPKNWQPFINKASFVLVILLISPFALFLWKNTLAANPTLQIIEQKENNKIKDLWLINKKKIVDIKLNDVQEFIANDNLQPAQDLLLEVMQKDPNNILALALQQTIKETQAAKEEAARNKANEIEQQRLEEERAQLAKRVSQLRVQAEQQFQKEDFVGCLQTAQNILKISPNNKIAYQGIEACNKGIAELQKAASHPSAVEAAKKKKEEDLQKILQTGETQARKKQYQSALNTWKKAEKHDPKKLSPITATIHQKISSLKKEITTKVANNIRRGKAARKKQNHLEAAKYFKAAHTIKPSDKKAKQLYQTQMKDNYILAEELYNEAIAYASLGSMDSAKNAIGRAEKLAKGNKPLHSLINKKIADFAQR